MPDLNESNRIANREQQITVHTSNVPKRSKIMGKTFELLPETPLPETVPKSDAEKQFLKDALHDNFIFSALDNKELDLLVNVMQKETAQEGTVIIKQGDVGDFFYVVDTGVVTFVVNDTMNVGSCTRGGSFGELALLYDAPRAATCIVDSDNCVLWKVDQNTFRLMLAKVADTQERNTSKILAKVPLFQKLTNPVLKKFSNALATVHFKAGERIVNKGDIGEVFYVIEDGEVRIHEVGYGVELVDSILSSGQWFGERALLTGEPRAASATAVTDVVALALDRSHFETIFGSLQEVIEHEMKKDCLEVLPLIAKSNILPTEVDALVPKMTKRVFGKGVRLINSGEPLKTQLLMIRSGKLSVFSDDGQIHVLQNGDAYGGQHVLNDDETKTSTDTVVVDEQLECFVLTRADIESVLGDVHRLSSYAPYVSKKTKIDMKLEDLEKHRILGRGAFGKVWLTTYKDHKEPYALKVMSKVELLEANMVSGTIREKDILESLDHPFILPLLGSFQDEKHIYLLLKLIQGGELFHVIHNKAKKRRGIPNDDAVFYAACVLDALSHFHHRMICYRDLKPENILVDHKGYCIIVDLGFAKIVANTKTYTLCGTPEYLAPEIVMSKGHDTAVDWWAFGVLIYEMLVGKSPFFIPHKDQLSMFKRIVHCKYSYPDSVEVPETCKDIISKLLQRNQLLRLGNLARGYLDLIEHPWFEKIDFFELLNKNIEAPWIPEVKDAFDSHHFKTIPSGNDDDGGRTLTEEEQKVFESF